MTRNKKYLTRAAIALWITSLTILLVFKVMNNRYFSQEAISKRITHLFQEQERMHEDLVFKVENDLLPSLNKKQIPVSDYAYWLDLYSRTKIGVFVYRSDSLIYWNNSQISVDRQYVYNIYNAVLVFKKRAIYTSKTFQSGNYRILLLSQLQENKALPSASPRFEFDPKYRIPPEVQLVDNEFSGEYGNVYPLTSISGQEVARFFIPDEYTKGNQMWENFLLGFCGYMFLLIGIIVQARIKKPHWQGLYSLFVVLISALYLYLDATYNLSGKNYEVGLYDSSLYASGTLIPSLGDFFNWILSFAIWSFLFFLYSIRFVGRKYYAYFQNRKWVYWLFGLISISSIIPLYLVPNYLIQNSTLALDFNYITYFNLNSLAGVGIMLFALMGYMLTNVSGSYFVMRNKGSWLLFLWGKICGFLALFFILRPALFDMLLILLYCAPMSAYLLVYFKKNNRYLSDFFLIFAAVWSALFIGYFLVKNTVEKRKVEASFYADKISGQSDPAASFYFQNAAQSFAADSLMQNLLLDAKGNSDLEEVIDLAISQHFSGYWNNYSILTFYKDSLKIEPHDSLIFERFESLLFESVGGDYGQFSPLYSDSNYWKFIGKLPVDVGLPNKGELFLVFETKKYMGQTGLPEFLIRRPYYLEILQKGFFTGRYVNGILVDNSGYGNMPLFLNEENLSLLKDTEFGHVTYFTQGNEAIVVVDAKSNSSSYLNTVSILFLVILIFISILRWFTVKFIPARKYISLGSQFRFFVIATITVTFVLLLVSSIFFTRQVILDQDRKFFAKTSEHIQSQIEGIDWDKFSDIRSEFLDQLESKLSTISSRNRIEINYYSAGGHLLYSSRPEIFREQFRANVIEPRGRIALVEGTHSAYFLNDQIGDIEYTSVFLPVYSEQQNLKGYVQIPFFSENAKRNTELSFSINQIVNYFTIFITIVILFTLLASIRFLRPLEELRLRILGLRIGDRLVPIEYRGSDEIAALVKAYNIAIADLQASAELLASSEREKAWREMAKQVAHEIKNPLTPLRLNLQMLEKAYKDGREDFDERFIQFHKSALEQIDTMAQIATDFSNFARLDKMEMSETNIVPLIKSVHSMFEFYMDNVEVKCDLPQKEIWVMGDKDLILRILNNLVKNACQAIGPRNVGWVEISAKKRDNTWEICVQDNGPGIPEAIKSSIFKPNFTTKTMGSGLGLVMCKNMVESMDGEIWFESVENEGTLFVFSLKAME